MILDVFQKRREREKQRARLQGINAFRIERLAIRLHWVFWLTRGWKPSRGTTPDSIWKARDAKERAHWVTLAEESQLGEELL